MKYIIFDDNGIPTPILFPDHLKHEAVASKLQELIGKPVSAGFAKVLLKEKGVDTSGRSIGLGLQVAFEDGGIILAALTQPLIPRTDETPEAS